MLSVFRNGSSRGRRKIRRARSSGSSGRILTRTRCLICTHIVTCPWRVTIWVMNWCRRLLAHIILRVIWRDGGIIHMVDAIVGMLCEAARCCWWRSELVSLRVVRTTRSVRRRWRIVIIAVVAASVVVFWRSFLKL